MMMISEFLFIINNNFLAVDNNAGKKKNKFNEQKTKHQNYNSLYTIYECSQYN